MRVSLRVLNLSKSLKFNHPTINYSCFRFPGGEEHIKINDTDIKSIREGNRFVVASSMTGSEDIMKTFLATDALRLLNRNARIELFSPYFPYARQDRRMIDEEPFSVRVMAELINKQQYDCVHILDPHSDVTTALVSNINVIDHTKFVRLAWNDILDKEIKNHMSASFSYHDLCLVSPDAGAEKKIYKIAKVLSLSDDRLILGSKRRNVIDGQILKSDFSGNVEKKICVIQDDICDGGKTFTELAQLLKQRGASKVYLIVSHGIFSKGEDSLKKILDGVYTTDSYKTMESDFIQTIPINSFYEL
jgi:ribose-phosphate pyrophosphokinase